MFYYPDSFFHERAFKYHLFEKKSITVEKILPENASEKKCYFTQSNQITVPMPLNSTELRQVKIKSHSRAPEFPISTLPLIKNNIFRVLRRQISFSLRTMNVF